jgi:hypothetical protein
MKKINRKRNHHFSAVSTAKMYEKQLLEIEPVWVMECGEEEVWKFNAESVERLWMQAFKMFLILKNC